MGVSTDGILVYGVRFSHPDDEESLPHSLYLAAGISKEDDVDEEDLLLVMAGEKVWDYETEKYSDFSARRDAALDRLGVEIVRHCSGDYPMFLLAVRGAVYTANRGDSREIAVGELVIDGDRYQKLIDFCERVGFELTSDNSPAWRLASYWG